MTAQASTTVDQDTVDRLSTAFHRCFSERKVAGDVFAEDAFFDLPPTRGPEGARS